VHKRKRADERRALSIDQVLSSARAPLRRLSPDEAYEAVANTEAILVDIRVLRARWWSNVTCSSGGSTRPPAQGCQSTNHDLPVIVFCTEGYTSSPAAASLQDLGLSRATDLVGGFHAWRTRGLPIVPPGKASRNHPAH
jgi:rhodanese-related sulfurtransferase